MILMTQMAFSNQQQQIEFSMDRPFLLELQYLQSRITEGTSLCSNDVDILDRSYATDQSSEMANSVNEIYSLLSRSPLHNFWELFSAIITYSKCNSTRIMAYSILSNRIKNEWPAIDEGTKQALKSHTVEKIGKCMTGEEDDRLLHCFNQVLVSMLRFEWNSLFKDFVSNIEMEGLNVPIRKLINNLNILKLVLEEGFNTRDEEMVSHAEAQHFRLSLQHDMRTILKFICLCLNNDGYDRVVRVKKCLETLRFTIDYIPAFELFNCNLIQHLVGFIGVPEFQNDLIPCFQEIFRFREANTTSNSHSKIAMKLLLILESYLKRFHQDQVQIEDYEEKEKQFFSTEDSFQSRKTLRRSPRRQNHSDILRLLYEFLIRYVPFMDKERGESDLEIQYESNIKLYFSQELYNAFKAIFWQIIAYIHAILPRFDPFFMEQQSEETLEESRRVVCCIRLMMMMFGKLKVQTQDELASLIERAAIFFATLPKEFIPYYLQFELLQEDMETAEEPPIYSADLQEQYKEFIKMVVNDKKLKKGYLSFINDKIDQIVTQYTPPETKGKKNIAKLQLSNYSILKLINLLNRTCWSAVYAYNANPDVVIQFGLYKLGGILTQLGKEDLFLPSKISKCFTINGKYMSQIYLSHNTIWKCFITTLKKSRNEQLIEYHLLLLQKILVSDRVMPEFELEEIDIIVEKLHGAEFLDPLKENLLGLYPSLLHLFAIMWEAAKKSTPFRITEMLKSLVPIPVVNVGSVNEFAESTQTKDTLQLQYCIYHFKRLIQMVIYLKSAYQTNIFIKGCPQMFSWIRTAIQDTIQMFEKKNCTFANALLNEDQEHFDIQHLLKFRKYYLILFKELASLTNMPTLEANENKSSRVRAIETEIMRKIASFEGYLRHEFVTQKRFKTKEFLGFAIEAYKMIISFGKRENIDTINESICTTMDSLQHWDGDSQLLLEKYKFWKEVVGFMLVKLNKKSKQHMMQLYQGFQATNIQTNCIEVLLEVFEEILDVLNKENKNNPDYIFPQYIDIFMATFEKLFSSKAKRQSVFQRLAHLLFKQTIFIMSLRVPLKANSRKDNMETLYILLQKHIVDKARVEFDQEHCTRLQRLLEQRNVGKWCEHLKDYVVYLRRLFDQRNGCNRMANNK